MHEQIDLTEQPGVIDPVGKILEERGTRYGQYENVSHTSQSLKAVVRLAVSRKTRQFPGLDSDMCESLDMICNKIARIVNGDPTYIDSWEDIAGYAKLVTDRLKEEQNV